ncbi:J domain-containing protein [Pseudarthrobacter sp. NPDC058119]|uniref:J domain-containing protein n=1 Tax=Pseudarthrobacter sp. NPDC058119 TaxID=3346348 RepID=UPI0036DD9903
MTDVPDYYAVLGVGRDATRQEISHAYRVLMRSHHPDMGGGCGDVDEQPLIDPATTGAPAQRDEPQRDELLGIMQAFHVLSDPGRRADYDRRVAARAATSVPVRKVRRPGRTPGPAIRITPVRWESGPWA